jgi:hypothetical protein
MKNTVAYVHTTYNPDVVVENYKVVGLRLEINQYQSYDPEL